MINLGYLKHGDAFEFDGETYIVGHTDGTGQGRVWCLNVKTRKRKLFTIDDGVEPLEEQKNE